MCGIVAGIADRNVTSILLEGLKRQLHISKSPLPQILFFDLD